MERWKLEESEGVMVYTDAYYEQEWNAPQNLREIVVQETNQIKSATDNRGTFDGGNADITFSVTGEDYRIAREFNALEKYTDEAYICLAFAEDMDGNVFYDANAANASEIDEIKSTSEGLQAGRVTNTGVAGTEVPYRGSIHRINEFVNYINAQNDNFSGSVMTESQRREAVKNELARVAAMDKQVAVLADDRERALGDLDRVSRRE